MSSELADLEALRSKAVRRYKLIAIAFGLFYAAYSIKVGSLGDTFFATSISVLLALSEIALAPLEIAELARSLFYFGDRLARGLVVAIAIGGSALALDFSYGLDILPQWLDTWIKRIGPALVLIAILALFASALSKRIFDLSENRQDALVRSYELPFYFLVIVTCGFVLTIFSGFPVEIFIPSSQGMPSTAFVWGEDVVRFLLTSIAVCSIWLVALSACLISRFIEFTWRIQKGKEGARSILSEADMNAIVRELQSRRRPTGGRGGSAGTH